MLATLAFLHAPELHGVRETVPPHGHGQEVVEGQGMQVNDRELTVRTEGGPRFPRDSGGKRGAFVGEDEDATGPGVDGAARRTRGQSNPRIPSSAVSRSWSPPTPV